MANELKHWLTQHYFEIWKGDPNSFFIAFLCGDFPNRFLLNINFELFVKKRSNSNTVQSNTKSSRDPLLFSIIVVWDFFFDHHRQRLKDFLREKPSLMFLVIMLDLPVHYGQIFLVRWKWKCGTH